MNMPWPTMQDGSALLLSRVTAIGNFIISIATKSGALPQPRNPVGDAPRWRRSMTSVCRSWTSDWIRRSRGTQAAQEASQSWARPLDVLLAAVPRKRNLSLFHSPFSDACLIADWRILGGNVQVIWDCPSTRRASSKFILNFVYLYTYSLTADWLNPFLSLGL